MRVLRRIVDAIGVLIGTIVHAVGAVVMAPVRALQRLLAPKGRR